VVPPFAVGLLGSVSETEGDGESLVSEYSTRPRGESFDPDVDLLTACLSLLFPGDLSLDELEDLSESLVGERRPSVDWTPESFEIAWELASFWDFEERRRGGGGTFEDVAAVGLVVAPVGDGGPLIGDGGSEAKFLLDPLPTSPGPTSELTGESDLLPDLAGVVLSIWVAFFSQNIMDRR